MIGSMSFDAVQCQEGIQKFMAEYDVCDADDVILFLAGIRPRPNLAITFVLKLALVR
jgi:hypothetical protein